MIDQLSHGILRSLGARSRVVSTSEGDVHAYDGAGRGAGTFVLLHGLGASATAYTQVFGLLRKRAARVLMPDLPGHGRSGAARGQLSVGALGASLREALDQLLQPEERATVLGCSLGGAAALGYALDRPERVRALVLASPGGAPPSEQELAELRARFDLRTREDARRFFAALIHRPPFYMRLLEKGLIDQLQQPTVQGFLSAVKLEDFYTEERVASLAPPATVIWGKSDRVLPKTGLEFFRRAMPPGTMFLEPDRLGHSPHLECPDLLVRHLLEAAARGPRPA